MDNISNLKKIKTEDKGTKEKKMDSRLQTKNLNYEMLNDQLFQLVSPKSALTVFSELFHDVKVKLHMHPGNTLNCKSYTATFKIDEQIYTANDISTSGAYEKACEKLLRNMLVKKLSELSEEKENDTIDAFPWEHFIKLAMHKLITRWEIQNASKAFNTQEETIIEHSKDRMKNIQRFPRDPSKYNPTQLLYQMKPYVEFIHTFHSISKQSRIKHSVQSIIDGVKIVGTGPSKKDAKRDCCIQAIKHFWKFDFRTTEEYCI